MIPADREPARQAAVDLAAAVGPAEARYALEPIARLEGPREALAVLALALARVHGRPAWLLAAASTALSPVLHPRALPADNGYAFGTVEPRPEQYAEAEDAVRLLQNLLTRLTGL
ncbi:hypothetical protein [Kitasatospora terrestris]|uniref:Uncharacterized protein n=1 Tax=Kitasatospora terrestris TaxID=258051 RepID=A0ABP9DI94_9ACTN